jgi:transposase
VVAFVSICQGESMSVSYKYHRFPIEIICHCVSLAAMGDALATMAQRWQMLHEEIEGHWEHLQRLTKQTAPALTDACGIGPDTAAQLLITFGDRGDRVRSEAAFAKLCGVCPMPASSGKTQRHRLNRGATVRRSQLCFAS